jgi:hypothetical protein
MPTGVSANDYSPCPIPTDDHVGHPLELEDAPKWMNPPEIDALAARVEKSDRRRY